MKKDDKLERAFDEYFEGMEIPEGLTEDAKKLNKKHKPLLARLTKYASALACVLIVCIVAAVGIYSGMNFNAYNNAGESSGSSGSASSSGSADDPGTGGGSGDNTGSSSGDTVLYDTYHLNDLEKSELSESEILKNASLAVIGQICEDSYAELESCYAYYENGELIIVKAEITIIGTDSRKIEIYVEFTLEGNVCEDLTDYYGGESRLYGDLSYLYYPTEDGSETTQYVFATVDGVKYYISVTSENAEAYLDYLEMLNNL